MFKKCKPNREIDIVSQNNKNKNTFASKNVLTKHKQACLSINGAQSVRLEKGTIEFINYFKQIPVPFKIYADLI